MQIWFVLNGSVWCGLQPFSTKLSLALSKAFVGRLGVRGRFEIQWQLWGCAERSSTQRMVAGAEVMENGCVCVEASKLATATTMVTVAAEALFIERGARRVEILARIRRF